MLRGKSQASEGIGVIGGCRLFIIIFHTVSPSFTIDLATVFDAILTSRQTREKLQCLYENLMSNNFRKAAVLKKYDL